MALNNLTQILDMPSYCFWAWLDVCLEAQQFSSALLTRLGLTPRVLSDIETEKIKTRVPIHLLQCMSDAGLTGLQFELQRSQPFSRYLCALLDDLQVCMQNYKVIGVTDSLRLIEAPFGSPT